MNKNNRLEDSIEKNKIQINKYWDSNQLIILRLWEFIELFIVFGWFWDFECDLDILRYCFFVIFMICIWYTTK